MPNWKIDTVSFPSSFAEVPEIISKLNAFAARIFPFQQRNLPLGQIFVNFGTTVFRIPETVIKS